MASPRSIRGVGGLFGESEQLWLDWEGFGIRMGKRLLVDMADWIYHRWTRRDWPKRKYLARSDSLLVLVERDVDTDRVCPYL
jgi:hypothetical protein